jgi:2-oxoglutarate/2-oxoacid ferredoxin oxidoreductase subunit alpha
MREEINVKEKISIRFSGDSGDGMQLTGKLFAESAAYYGNSISTFPDFPSEIRAPQGTVAGVSGFQVHIGSEIVLTPGDYSDVLVAMNPAALKANLKWLQKGGTLIVDADSFDEKSIQKAGYAESPLADESLAPYNVIAAPVTSQTKLALEDTDLDNKSKLRCKNMFALGITLCMFNKPMDKTFDYIDEKFGKKPVIAEANKKVLKEGHFYAENTHAQTPWTVESATIEKGTYRPLNGNTATAWGLMAAAESADLPLFLGSYPITPATDVMQELAKHKSLGVKVVQCEDEIAGMCTTVGAAYAGSLAATNTSGPGLALKGEAIGLAVMLELPVVIVNVQRGGPSTGLPTKTEQSDLMQALYGRNGESPCIVIAASTPSDCFDYAYMASKLALEHMTPVILLTDGFLGNGTQPWRIKTSDEMPPIKHRKVSKPLGDHTPFMRDAETLARNWAIPGTPDMMHRIGSLEKDYVHGQASHVPENHQKMSEVREEKVQRVANYIPQLEVMGEEEGDLLVVGWGGTYGHLSAAVKTLQKEGKSVTLAHFNYIKPLPKNTAEIFSKYKKIVVCELNLGQFADYLKAQHQQFEYKQYNKLEGLPFTEIELVNEFKSILEEK